MIITAITAQTKNVNRVNVMVDGAYRFSLDIFQVGDLGIRVGREYTEDELNNLEMESQFGKTYGRALEYALMRPHSAKEVRDYLYRKTRATRTKSGELRPGISPEITKRVFDRLVEKGYINDESFARFWVENRDQKKGISQKKLRIELLSKGVDDAIITAVLSGSERDETDELRKVIAKKSARYADERKLIEYLMRQGFPYEAIRLELDATD